MEKLKSMVNYILEIDAMGTAEFCDAQGIPHPYFTGEVKSSAKLFLQIDAVKHRLFVAHAKALRKEQIENKYPSETIPHNQVEAEHCYSNLLKSGQLYPSVNKDFVIRQIQYAIQNQVKTYIHHLDIQEKQFEQSRSNFDLLESKAQHLLDLIKQYHALFNLISGEVTDHNIKNEWDIILKRYQSMLES